MKTGWGYKMKRIGIITIHTDFNYGAVLQAIASQRLFEIKGYDSEIIDYENPVIAQQSNLLYKQDGRYIGYIKTFVRNTLFGRYWYYKKAIKDLDQYRKKSVKQYHTVEELNDCPYDVLIAGSDQLWNPVISRGLDPVFLLQFSQGKKKVSFSTSMGSRPLLEEEKEVLKKALSDFSKISVRENFAREQLMELVDKDIKVTLDPTLLLGRDIWWNDYASKSKYANKNENYILTYFVGGNKEQYRPVIAQYAKKMNMKVRTIQYSNYTWKESNEKILGASIVDFIALIANADLVITDSFHGVAFSVNMGSNFIAIANKANPVRVKEFLQKVGLEDRINMDVDDFIEVDYDKVYPKLNDLREDSINWILNAIG